MLFRLLLRAGCVPCEGPSLRSAARMAKTVAFGLCGLARLPDSSECLMKGMLITVARKKCRVQLVT